MDDETHESQGRLTDKTSSWKNRIDAADILNTTLLDLENPYNCYTLLGSVQSTFIQWLQRNRLLIANYKCDKCGQDCKLYKRSRLIDGYQWRCKNNHEVTIRKNSFFKKSHMYLQDVMNFALEYAIGSSLLYC